MSTSIKLKKSSVAGRVPAVDDIDYGELAINYADGKIYYKNSSNQIKAFIDSAIVQSLVGSGGGAASGVDSAAIISLIDSAYVSSRISFENAANVELVKQYATADSGQTVFTGFDYQSNNLMVFLNGILLDPRVDYTASNGNSVTLNAAADSGDQLYLFDHTSLFNLENAIVDSADVTNIVNTAYVQARQDKAYSSLTGVPTAFTPDGVDSGATTGLINTAYIQARQDFAFSSLTGTPTIFDSADVTNIVDTDYVEGIINTAYIQARQDFTYASLTGTPNILDSADVTDIVDASYIQNIVNTAYVQARQDFSYASITGKPNILDSADVQAITSGSASGVDSAAIQAMIDSDYVASRVSLAYAGNASVQNYKFVADSGQTAFTGLSFSDQFVQVYLNGVLLLDSDDYVKSNGNTVTLTSAADSGDQLIVSDFTAFFTNQTVDSAQINSLIDSALGNVGKATVTNYKFVADSAQTVFSGTDATGKTLSFSNQLVQVHLNGVLLLDSDDYTASNNIITLTTGTDSGDQLIISDYKSFFTSSGFDSAGIESIIDSAYIQARQSAQDFAYSSLTGAPNVLDSSDVTTLIDASIDALVDGAPTALDTLNELATQLNNDSNAIAAITNTLDQKLNIVDAFDGAYSSLTGTPNILDSAHVNTIVTSYGYSTYDSANTIGLVDSAYIQARQTAQDFAYSSLTGVPNVLDSADVIAITSSVGGVDSAAIQAMIDSDYVASRVSLAYAGNASVQNYKFIADSDQTVFSGLSFSDQFVQVYLNGVLLLDSDDYAKSNGNTITLTSPINAGDQLIVSDFTAFFTNQTVDSAQINSLIDSAIGSVGRATVTNYKFVADSAQTVFSGTDATGKTLSFSDQLVQVHLNGVLLLDSDDYVASNNTITLTTGIDSGDQLIISDYKSFFTYNGFDSADIESIIDSAYIQARQVGQDFAYSSLTGAPTVFDSDQIKDIIDLDYIRNNQTTYASLSEFNNDTHFLDSNTVTGVIDAAYVQARQTAQDFAYSSLTGTPSILDSADVAAIQDFAYSSLTGTPNILDSADVAAIQDFAYSSLTGTPNILDSNHVTTLIDASIDALVDGAPTALDTLNELATQLNNDSDAIAAITNTLDLKLNIADVVDQDFAYSSLTGAPNVLDSADVLAIASEVGGVDSAAIQALIDSDYVASRVSLAYAGNASVQNYKFVADSGQTTFTGLSFSDQLVQVYLNGVLLLDSDDYAKSGGDTITLTSPINAGDQLIVSDFTAFFTNQTVDSAQINSLIDSALGNVGKATVTNYKFEADSAQTIFTGVDENGLTLSYSNQLVQVYLNGVLLLDSDDYTKSGGDTITLTSGADSGDQLIVSDYKSFFTSSGFDSAGIESIIDSAYIQLRQTPQDFAYSSLTGAPVIDSAYVQARQTDQDFAYSSLTGAPNVLDSANVITLIDSSHIINIIGQGVAPTDSATFSGMTISNNLTVNGNMIVHGTQTTVHAETITVENPMIHLASLNENTDAIDIGFIGHYSDDGGSTKNHTGLIRDATNQEYYLFESLVQATLDDEEPSLTVNVGGTNWSLATLNAGDVKISSLAINGETVDSAYVQARQTAQDFAYSSLTGTPNVLDSAEVISLIDSAYVQARQTTTSITGGDGIDVTQGYALTGSSNDNVSYETLRNIRSIEWKPDGTKLFVFSAFNDTTGRRWEEHTLTTAWDISTASDANSDFYVGSQTTAATGANFSENGLYFYVVDNSYNVYQYTLSIAWDVSTASHTRTQSFYDADAPAWETPMRAVRLNSDGTKIILMNNVGSKFGTFDLSTAYDISSLSSNATDVTTWPTSGMVAFNFAESGTKVYTTHSNGNIYKWSLSTAYDMSTVGSTADESFDTGFSTTFFAATVEEDAGKIFAIHGNSPAYVKAFSLAGGSGNTISVTDSYITDLIDSAYIQANQTAQDFAYSSLTGTPTTIAGYGITDAFDGAYSSLTGTPTILDSADVASIAGSSGGGGLDSAAAINIVDNKLLQLDIGDVVGVDGNPGEVLQSDGNGNSSWTDIKLMARQKAFAMSLIFG